MSIGRKRRSACFENNIPNCTKYVLRRCERWKANEDSVANGAGMNEGASKDWKGCRERKHLNENYDVMRSTQRVSLLFFTAKASGLSKNVQDYYGEVFV